MATAAERRVEIGDRFPLERLGVPLSGPTIVYFYPADFTAGCTREAHEFQKRYADFRAAGYDVVGVSTDTDDSHGRFRNECGLEFPLVADADQSLSSGLGLMKDYGEHGRFAARVTLLLDAEGIVRRIWDVSDISTHVEDVLAAARELA